jgi:hypothetical protein
MKCVHHKKNKSLFMKKTIIGIQWWNLPHISIHCPQKIPDTRNIIILCDEYPGTQSIFIPAEGIAHECITSLDEANKCNRVSVGIAIAPVACNFTIFETPLFIGLY